MEKEMKNLVWIDTNYQLQLQLVKSIIIVLRIEHRK